MLMQDRYFCHEKSRPGANMTAREVWGFRLRFWCRFTGGKSLTKLNLKDN